MRATSSRRPTPLASRVIVIDVLSCKITVLLGRVPDVLLSRNLRVRKCHRLVQLDRRRVNHRVGTR